MRGAEPSYEGKLSLIMVVPLDIFYEVLLRSHQPSTHPPLFCFWFVDPR